MDDDQQFCLRWNNHQSTLISVFDTLLENGTLVDCTLAAEGKFLKAHKVVLSACSPYFATLLSQQYDKHPIFILKDVKFQELRAMMDYMYRGEVNISQDQLAALLKAAESLQIKGLSDSRGGSSTQKPTNEHKTLSVPVAGKGGSSTGYTLEQKRPRHTLDTQELSGSREGSSSPTSRKRKKIRRRSVDNVMADNHEHSNSSSHSMQVNSSIIPSSNTSAAIASISATAATSLSTSSTVAAISGTVGAVTGINVTKKTENMSNAKIGSIECENDDDDDDDNDDELDENDKQIGVVKKEQTKRKSHAESDPNKDGSDMLIEPKSEYDDGNDETVEDLTLDDEELLEDLDQAGPSHGGGEGSSQGYAQWQVDRSSQDEVFMAAQDAAGQQRDPQGEGLRRRLKATPSPDEEPCDLRLITPASVFKELVSIAASLPPTVPPPPPSLAAITAQTSVVGSTYAAGIAAAVAAAASPGSNLPSIGAANQGTGMPQSHSLQAAHPHHSPLHSVKFPKMETIFPKLENIPAGIPVTSAPLTSPLLNYPMKSGGSNSGSGQTPSGSGISPWGAFTCQRCGNSYARPHSLNRHIRFECGVEPKFECPICHKKSKHKHNLVLHMRTHQNR